MVYKSNDDQRKYKREEILRFLADALGGEEIDIEIPMNEVMFPTKNFTDVVLYTKIRDMLDRTEYFDAPAAKGHHGAYRGGLADHSMEVAKMLSYYQDNLTYIDKAGNEQHIFQNHKSPVIVGLLHDICKTDDYKFTENGSIEFKKPYEMMYSGHGSKSILILMKYGIQLTEEEIQCIVYHMGAFVDSDQLGYYSAACARYPSVLYTHTADMHASQIIGI